uniref:Uncharacterized protein n=1 Tax=Musca domestica TaxID=7370 RepID=A0A1I8MJN3_MUSDO
MLHNSYGDIRNDVLAGDDDDDDEDGGGHYAEIDVVTSNDYYYITNLNQYYDEQHSAKATYKLPQHHTPIYKPAHQQHQHRRSCDSSSSSSWSNYTYNNHNKYQANRSTSASVFTQCHTQPKADKGRYCKQKSSQNSCIHDDDDDNDATAGAGIKNTNNILRNTQKRCRRKLFAFNFMLKNFITYRFKYDIL